MANVIKLQDHRPPGVVINVTSNSRAGGGPWLWYEVQPRPTFFVTGVPLSPLEHAAYSAGVQLERCLREGFVNAVEEYGYDEAVEALRVGCACLEIEPHVRVDILDRGAEQ